MRVDWALFAGFVAFVAATSVLAGAFVGRGEVALAQFRLWTNLLFLWPLLRAWSLRGWVETVAIGALFVVSTMHHGCLKRPEMTAALARYPFAVLLVGLLVFGVVTSLVSRPSLRTRRGEFCLTVSSVLGGAGLVTLIVALGLPLDNCLGGNELIWEVADSIFSCAVLLLIVVYVLQFKPASDRVTTVHTSETYAVLYGGIVVLVVLTLYNRVGPASELTSFVGLAVYLAIVAVIRLGQAWAVPEQVLRLDAVDVVALVLLSAIALSLYLFDNTPAAHGWWHVLAAASIYFGLEATYRDVYCIFLRY